MPSKIKVLHLTTHNEECGIARYQEQFIQGMKPAADIENVFFDVSPNKTRFMEDKDYEKVLTKFKKQLKNFDILHIQHELSFYKHRELQSVIDFAHAIGKKVIVTIHTALDVEYKKAKLQGVGPRAVRRYLRECDDQKKFERVHLNPVKAADLIIVHNEPTKQSLINHHFPEAKIKKIRLPVPALSFKQKSTELHKALKNEKSDIIFCTVGFISRSKGVDQAVKTLSVLPKNYKLAIIGGLHPKGPDQTFFDELQEYIAANGLKHRVHITGYVQEDERMNALIRECDICVYPYDAHYYSYVSSAALNNALANHKATIAYPTQSFKEINQDVEVIDFCDPPNTEELARHIQKLDIKKQSDRAKQYAKQYAYDKEAVEFADIYRQLLKEL